ncbi:potassium-transporting ATPase subunit KdpA [Pendulispora brunnea]|uniref:Potassium-transporting ATPase potassium-binding subunit n=1 Tax=Pendulispora brunnea TaxID=2905690 RepID=A0ABZ2KID7_9BACT
MTTNGIFQILLYLILLAVLSKPLGDYMARVYTGEATIAQKVLGPVERLIYRVLGIDPTKEMTWKTYAVASMLFNIVGIFVVYLLQRIQGVLPANPQGFGAVTPDSSFNTAISFGTNTNWQGYGGESTMSYLTQMLGLNVQNFVSAAVGMAVLVALIRGFTRRSASTLGNFWTDLTRSTLYILLPLSLILAVLLVSQGVVQSFSSYGSASLLEATKDADGKSIVDQVIPLGPAASQIAIKQLGTNGGGFFNANSAHPFENPTGLANFLEVFSILILSAALCHTFGKMVKDPRQGWALLAAMYVIFVPLLFFCVYQEQGGNPALAHLPIDQAASALSSGGNMEGKEVRFGIANSGLWAAATTAASNGSVNAAHDSLTPLGGLVPMWLMQLGEIIFGGVGCGLYGMVMFAIVAVFVAGLMVGRTPEYLGKKIEAYEMKMASIAILVPCALVLVGTAIACTTEAGQKGPLNPSAHGFSEILYALSSASNNNGSAFGGLSANTPFYNTLLGICMFLSRFWLMIPVLAAAGALAKKKIVPQTSGTLPTHTPLFVAMLVGTIVIVGALTFIPALALGPIVEHLLALGP